MAKFLPAPQFREESGKGGGRLGQFGYFRHLLGILPLLLAVSAIAGPPPPHLGGNLAPAASGKEQPALPARAAHRVAVRIPPLHWAAIEGDAEEARRLLDGGAEVNATETLWGGESALHWAAYGGRPGAVRVLIEAGAAIEARDDDGETAVREALRPADSGYLALTALLAAGADPEAASLDGDTALHEAVQIRRAGGFLAVSLLRLFGADPNSTNNEGATPLHYAALQPWEWFSGGGLANASSDPHRRRVQIDARDNRGLTPLHWVVSRSGSATDRHVMGWLMNLGADINAIDNRGSTPLDWAEFAGLDALAGILRAAGGVNSRMPPIDP